MRICGYILAFYIILLAAVPCCAIDNCKDDQTTQTSDHGKDDSDCNNCSPFFNCEGCATATVICQPFQFEIIALQGSPVYTGYQQTYTSRSGNRFLATA
jgi:hypothetical protein